MNKEVTETVKRKTGLWRKYRQTGSRDILEKYKEASRKVKETCEKAQKDHQNKIAAGRRERRKEFWQMCKNNTTSRPGLAPSRGTD